MPIDILRQAMEGKLADIEKWLAEVGLDKYASTFADAEIEFTDLIHLTDDDLKELGLPMGPRRRALDEISRIGAGAQTQVTEAWAPASDQSSQQPVPVTLSSDAERRHLTVMFVDLVGSTEMAAKIDPEDMRNVITNYQNTIAGIVARFDGFVAKFMGDGVLCYFGWPACKRERC